MYMCVCVYVCVHMCEYVFVYELVSACVTSGVGGVMRCDVFCDIIMLDAAPPSTNYPIYVVTFRTHSLQGLNQLTFSALLFNTVTSL